MTVTMIDTRQVCAVRKCSTALRPDSPEVVCAACVARLRAGLRTLYRRGRSDRGASMPTLTEEVRFTSERQGRGSKVSIGIVVRSSEPQAPLADQRADTALRDLKTTLVSWLRYLYDRWMPTTAVCLGISDGEGLRRLAHGYQHVPHCAPTIEGMAEYLALRPTWLAETPEAGDLYAMVMDGIDRCWRAIDRRPDRQYAGQCDEPDPDTGAVCGGDVYGWPDRKFARCSTCGLTYDAASRREELLNSALSLELTAAELSKALPQLMARDSLSVQTIHTWARNGRIVARRRNGRGWPLYSVADVVEVATSTPTRNRRPRHAEEVAAVA
ncbi:hypothetical protein DMC64_41705 [Amycolatopsis sp. WAC 04197]|uniref:hypothetical protein n=1 Tax=Amycolatopsis sp. WAC 04197 TaxID=2203199 RepID=UPI000F78C1A5|nr:hypothetical protein [Amycolatopsis sp. WAC 04197]RSN38586.1 hypothetical protein DMC64_41705 [Amycolatopsis sp. WAC 04197]